MGIALVGMGFMEKVHRETFARLRLNVRRGLGSSPQESQKAAAKWNIPRGYQSFDEILEDAEVHIVHLCVPESWHCDMARLSLEAGKHVLCEMPLAMNPTESAELVSLAKQHCHLARNAAEAPGSHREGDGDTLKQCFRSFSGYIDEGDFSVPTPFPTFADGHREILVCEAIPKSHQSQCWIPLKESTR